MSVESSEVFRLGEVCKDKIDAYGDLRTVPEVFEEACKKFSAKLLYRFRDVTKKHIELTCADGKEFITYEHGPVKQLTYGEFHGMVKAVAAGLIRYNPELKPNSKIGIYMDTRLEWSLALQAAWRNSLTVTTVYATLGWEALMNSLNEAELTTLVCAADNVENMDRYLGDGKVPLLKKLVVCGDTNYKSKYFEMKNIYDVMLDGHANPAVEVKYPAPDDLAILMYTSGTTGSPKGVMILHKNIIANIAGVLDSLKLNENDSHISYLPFAHIYEMVVHNCITIVGGDIFFANPRTFFAKPGGAKLVGCLSLAKPTVFCGVPKVWESIRKGVTAKVSMGSAMEQFLFNMVMMEKVKGLKEGKIEKVLFPPANIPLEDVVFKKVRAMIGGRVRLIVSGGAPLAPETQIFMQAVIGTDARIVQVYGLTEVVGASHFQRLEDPFTVNNVGKAVASCEIKLVSVPSMGYSVKNDPPKGEVWMKGPIISKGYYKKPELTKEVYRDDGWFRSGDIASLDKEGNFTIIDRVKNLVKLSHGEYVALKGLEVAYCMSNFAAPNSICCYADPLKDHIVGIIVPDPLFSAQFAKKMKLGTDKLEEIIKHPTYIKAVEESLKKIAEKGKFKKWEVLTRDRFVVRNDLWTPQNGLLTAASKLKRNSLREKYQADFDMLYSGGVKKAEEESEGESEVKEESKYPKFFDRLKQDYVEV